MGSDPQHSVTNSYGQAHDVRNLFVAGASLFPTIAAVNPTATLCALALRTADYIRI
jgi:choline dehydrogenase-like flavoprotein